MPHQTRLRTVVLTFLTLAVWSADPKPSGASIQEVWGFEPHFVNPPGGMADLKLDFGAKGDGVSDDTAAVLKAFGGDSPRDIYIPAGIYLVNQAIVYGINASKKKKVCVIGEARSRTVIRLADHSAGFGDPAKPKDFIRTLHPKQQGEQNMQQYLQHLTIEIGRGNSGAVALNYHSNNTGAVTDVSIRASDPIGSRGAIGLACKEWEVGPALVRYLSVEGFATGISLTRIGNRVTLEHLRVTDCATAVQTTTVAIRDLVTERCSAGVVCSGTVVLLDAVLRGSGPAAVQMKPAKGGNGLVIRNLVTSGFAEAITGDGTAVTGPVVAEHVSGAPAANWDPAAGMRGTLNLAVVESPEIPYPQTAAEWAVMPAKGDIAEAMQQAIDAGTSTIFLHGYEQSLSRTVILRNRVQRIQGLGNTYLNAKLGSTPVLRLADGAAPVVIIDLVYGNYGNDMLIEQASKRTLVIRHGGGGYRTAPEGRGGTVFIENLVGQPFVFTGVNAWVRDLNTEAGGPNAINITNDGSRLWLLGHKTEDFTTKVRTLNGGFTEVLGGTYRQNWDAADFARTGMDAKNPMPLFEVIDAHASFTFNAWGPGIPYRTLLRETRGGETRNLPNTAAGTLVVGYRARP